MEHTQCPSRAKTSIKRHDKREPSPEGLSKTSVTKIIKNESTNEHNKPIWHNKILNIGVWQYKINTFFP